MASRSMPMFLVKRIALILSDAASVKPSAPLLPTPSRHLLSFDTSLLPRVFHGGGRLIAQLDALLPNLGTHLRSRSGCEQKHRPCACQAADQNADQHALRTL